VAQDVPPFKAWGEVTLDLLTRLGIKVDYAAVDWGTVVARRTQKSPPGQGGWHMFHTFHNGASCVNPAHLPIRANSDEAWFGWPNSPQVEAEVEADRSTKISCDARPDHTYGSIAPIRACRERGGFAPTTGPTCEGQPVPSRANSCRPRLLSAAVT
jgi:hypothetical protein